MTIANKSKTSPCISKLNDPVLPSDKSKTSFCAGKEKSTLLIGKKSKASSELLCASKSPNKKQKLVKIFYSCTVNTHKFMLKSVVIFNQVIKKFVCLRNGCWNFSLPVPRKSGYLKFSIKYCLQVASFEKSLIQQFSHNFLPFVIIFRMTSWWG